MSDAEFLRFMCGVLTVYGGALAFLFYACRSPDFSGETWGGTR